MTVEHRETWGVFDIVEVRTGEIVIWNGNSSFRAKTIGKADAARFYRELGEAMRSAGLIKHDGLYTTFGCSPCPVCMERENATMSDGERKAWLFSGPTDSPYTNREIARLRKKPSGLDEIAAKLDKNWTDLDQANVHCQIAQRPRENDYDYGYRLRQVIHGLRGLVHRLKE